MSLLFLQHEQIMNHLLEEALENALKEENKINAVELTKSLIKDQMELIVEYLKTIRKAKHETNKHSFKVAFQNYIDDFTNEYLKLEGMLNKLEAHE